MSFFFSRCSNFNTTENPSRKLTSGAADSPVRFEHARGIGSVIRSCRGRCCGAFKAFACPYSDLLNDNAENGCASDMFFEINVRGRLHPSLFSQLCVEGPLALQC
uniref:GPI-anchored protein LLG1-like domain-containing protein n=1 Tax=Setaria italica TaxID=4555 RepID=K3YDH5_SETIT